MPDLTIGAATQIGRMEYQLFSQWYQNTYGQEPPPNDANIVNNPQYLWWKNTIRGKVWSPRAETEATIQMMEEAGIPSDVPYNPPELPTGETIPEGDMKPYVYTDENGYRWAVQPSPLGGPPEYTFLGREETGMTPYQEAQLDFQREKLARDEALRKKQLQWQQGQRELEQLARQTEGMTETDFQRRMGEIWGELRQKLIRELEGEPANWLKVAALKYKPNPYQVDTDPGEELEAARKELKEEQQRQREATAIAKRGETGAVQLDPDDVRFIQQTKEKLRAAEKRVERAEEQIEDVRRSAPLPYEPRGIETPGWLRGLTEQRLGKYIPGIGNIPGEAPPAIPLSGQRFGRMSPTQLEKWRGYTEFAGQEPVDLLWKTSQMLPEPKRGSRWTPTRQRV